MEKGNRMTHEHDNKHRGWIGVDFDGTLAEYNHWVSPTHVGQPIGQMVDRVKRWIAEGREVRIFTARVWPFNMPITPDLQLLPDYQPDARTIQAAAAALAIRDWCQTHIGQVLTITCVKDYAMTELYDDRAVQVEKNTGRLVGYSTREPQKPAPPKCANCDSAMPEGCGGLFRDEGPLCRLNHEDATA